MRSLPLRSTVAGAVLALAAGVFSAQPAHAAAVHAGGSAPAAAAAAAAAMPAQEQWGPYIYYDVVFPTRVAAVQGLTTLMMIVRDLNGVRWPIQTEIFSAADWIGEVFVVVWRIRWRDSGPN